MNVSCILYASGCFPAFFLKRGWEIFLDDMTVLMEVELYDDIFTFHFKKRRYICSRYEDLRTALSVTGPGDYLTCVREKKPQLRWCCFSNIYVPNINFQLRLTRQRRILSPSVNINIKERQRLGINWR